MDLHAITLKWDKTSDDVVAALRECNGSVAKAADILRCDRSTLYKYLHKHPELEEILRDIRVEYDRARVHENYRLLDKAFESVEELLDKRDPAVTMFTLRSIGGWNDKQTAQQQAVNINLNSKPYKHGKEINV